MQPNTLQPAKLVVVPVATPCPACQLGRVHVHIGQPVRPLECSVVPFGPFRDRGCALCLRVLGSCNWRVGGGEMIMKSGQNEIPLQVCVHAVSMHSVQARRCLLATAQSINSVRTYTRGLLACWVQNCGHRYQKLSMFAGCIGIQHLCLPRYGVSQTLSALQTAGHHHHTGVLL